MLIVEKTFDEMFRPQEKLHWTKKYYGAWKPEENSTYYIIIIAINYVQNPVSFSCIVNNNEFSFCMWAKRMTTIFTFCFCEAYVFLGLRDTGLCRTMYDFHNSTDTLKFWTEKRAINKTFLFFIWFWWNLVKL